ncbi:YicC family protein [Bacillus sp. ISL-47]|uniref:YicC/YloC family endoribonuclease n=1 Tax=Bacillus sp. ISL-47 TaxID=2819130 RepID=UPI001BED0E17|nr:YicC/YloC family endoribonuclease [Bacillus sp. ISL-47]MBT2687974.1 YicC family protein [Bacillus sp. ISL-47]MBT2708243.1 YicC family protein [Pseudomonas sp. ISL-84]
MVVSMTGFGRSKKDSGQFSITVEIKTVNHRFSEFHMRMPRQLMHMEDKIKKKLGEHIGRGRIEVYVTIEGEGLASRKVNVDWELLDEYYQYITAIKTKYDIQNDLSIEDIIREELIGIEEKEKEAGNEELSQHVLSAAEEACLHLTQMRQAEGLELEKDVRCHLGLLSQRVILLRELSPKVVQLYQERLEKRIKDYLDGQIDESRILTEVAVFADKADINEELARLQSHISQFEKTLQLTEPVGRKLDFLLQEMNREANTIGSKANDAAIAAEVVEIKSLLEKMKEQIQNIE